jgi:predicted metal-binding membrane protein
MTSAAGSVDGRVGQRVTVPRAVLVAGAAFAWVATIRWAQSMGNGPGTMGLGWADFVGVWAVMMAAMMLPTVSHEIPAAVQRRTARSLAFAIGYVSVWAAVGLVAYAAATGAAHLALHDARIATGMAPIVFAACGLYQFSPVKTRALAYCWPQNQAPGAAPDDQLVATAIRGVRQGFWCLASSWALMALIIAFGVMNVTAMIAIFIVTYAERRRFPSAGVRHAIGLASLAFAGLVLVHPQLAAGLHVTATHLQM